MIGLRILTNQWRRTWRLKAALSDVRLRLFRHLFSLRTWAGTEVQDARSLFEIGKLVLTDSALAALAAAVLVLLNPIAARRFGSAAEPGYPHLLAAIAGAGAVFIGLYYATLTAAMTSVYAQMPQAVRQLLVRERYGNAYMRFLAGLTLLALLLLALDVLGFSTSSSAPSLLVALSGLAVIGFVKLGTWAFSLFDPAIVSASIFRELTLLVRQAGVGGYQWRNVAFQQFAQSRAASALQVLGTLVEVCRNQDHLRGRPLLTVVRSSIRFAAGALSDRQRIPTGSQWFPRRYVQIDWYRAADSSVAIAHQTGTVLQPETAREPWWIEHRIEEFIIKALGAFLQNGDLDLAQALLLDCRGYVEELSREGYLVRGWELSNRIEDAVTSHVAQEWDKAENPIGLVALLDHVLHQRIACLLAAAQWADTLDRARMEQVVATANWQDARTPYGLGLGALCVARAEWLADRLRLELDVQGEIVSPTWYVAELMAQPNAEALAECVRVLTESGQRRFVDSYRRFRDANRWWAASCVLSAELHYWKKMAYHFERLSNAWRRLSDGRLLADLPWPAFKEPELAPAVGAAYSDVVARMAELLPRMPPKPDYLPDYPGQFLHTCGEALFDAIATGAVEEVERIFRAYFVGSLAKHGDLQPPGEIKDLDPVTEGKLLIACAPLLDLVDLSGYGLLLSEAFPDRMTWPSIEAIWTRYFESRPGGATESALAATISLAKSRFGIGPRDLLRVTWEQRVGELLRSLPRRRSSRSPWAESEADHPSPLVRVMARDTMIISSYDGLDVFVAVFLSQRPGFNQQVRHRAAVDLARTMERERLRTDRGAEE